MAGNEEEFGSDFLRSSRRNNTKPQSSNKEPLGDMIKSMDTVNVKQEKINKTKLDGEQKITAEKKKQNAEEAKHIAYSKQDAKLLKEVRGLRNDLKRSQQIELEFQRKSSEENLKREESLKRQKAIEESLIQKLKEGAEQARKDFEFDTKMADFKEKMSESQFRNNEKYFDSATHFRIQEMNNLAAQKKLEEDINRGIIKSKEKARQLTYELLQEQKQINKEQENYNKLLEIQANSKQAKVDSFAKGLGFDTSSSTYKYLTGQGKTESEKALLKSSAKLEIAGNVLNAAGKAITSILNLFVESFKDEMKAIMDIYENTYQKVAVTTQINQDTYHDWQRTIPEEIRNAGLQSAMKSSEVMNTLPEVIETGISDFSKATEKAFNTTIARKISPYVDTLSSSFIDLENKFGDKFTKSILGTSKYTQELVGSNRVTNKVLDSVLETLGPVMLASEKQLMSEQDLLIAEALVKEGGMSQREAIEYVSNLTKATSDHYGALTGEYGMGAQVAVAGGARTYSEIEKGQMGFLRDILGNVDNTIVQGSLIRQLGITGFANQSTDFNKIYGISERARNLGKTSRSASNLYDVLLSDLSKGTYTTEKQQIDNFMAQGAMMPAVWGSQNPVLFQTVGSILDVVKAILAAVAVSGVGNFLGGKGGGGKLLGKAGSAITKLGGGSMGAGLATVGGVAAGGLMVAKGGTDIYKDLTSGEGWTGKTTASAVGVAGGAAGAGALLALGASNPIGWVALAVGGIALGARKLQEVYEDEAHAREDFNEEFKKANQEEINRREKTAKDYVSSLNTLEKQVKKSATDEQAKQLLLEAGIATEDELNNLRGDQRQAMLDLITVYKEEVIAKTQVDNAALKGLLDQDSDVKAGYANKAKDYVDWMMGENGWNREVHELSDTDRDALYKTVAAVATYGESNYDSMSKEEKKVFDKIKEVGLAKAKEGNHTTGLNWEDMDKIIDAMDSQQGATRDLIGRSLQDSTILNDFSNQEAVQKKWGVDSYLNVDWTSAFDNYLAPAYRTDDADRARELLDEFKKATYTTSIDDIKSQDTKDYINKIVETHNLGSFRIGSNLISRDGLAMLHKGESVLTAAATSNLKEFLGTENIKDFSSESLTTNISEGFSSFAGVIADQTRALVYKLDEVISAIKGSSSQSVQTARTATDRSRFALS